MQDTDNKATSGKATSGQATAATRQPAPRTPYDRHLRMAWAALFWERAWPALWPVLAIGGIFANLVLFDVLPRLNPWLHLAILVVLALSLGVLLYRNFHRFQLPTREEARRRIERASGTTHRPLTALEDRHIAGGMDGAAKTLWLIHMARLRARLKQLRIGAPAAGLGRIDPWGARAVIGLALVVAIAVGGFDGSNRLTRAVTPDLAGDAKKNVATLDIWIAPPTYTGLPPIFLSGTRTAAKKPASGAPTGSPSESQAGAAPLNVPTGSTVLAQVNGGRDKPKLVIDKAEFEFEAVGAASHKVSAELTQGTKLSIIQGRNRLGGWDIAIVPDLPPSIGYQVPPARTERAALRIEYAAEDDYGVEQVKATIRRVIEAVPKAEGPKTEAPKTEATGENTQPAQAPEPKTGEAKPAEGKTAESTAAETKLSEDVIELPLPLPGLSQKNSRASSYHDLTAHPWAGLPVEVQLEATDAIGQTGRSEAFATVMPERIFNHPIARAIVEVRKDLTRNPDERRKPSDTLVGIAARPMLFYSDIVVYMALRAAAGRLIFDKRPTAVAAIQSLLWDTALRVEDGDVSIAERELREVERALQEALANNASDAEIERLMNELQRAIDRYLQSMLAQMQDPQRQQQLQFAPNDPNTRTMSRNDLQRMVDRARDLARSGARDQAREMLSRLQEMLENLRMGMMSQQQMQANQQAQQMMRNLQDMAREQRKLLDRSFRRQQNQQGQRGQQGQRQQGQRQQGQQGQQGEQGEGDEGDEDEGDEASAGQQESLRRRLGELMRQMGEMGAGDIPRAFGRAERAMRDATRALGQGQPGEAIGPQSEALDQLQQGAQSMMEQMGRQFGHGPGQGDDPQLSQQPPGRAMERRDPLGRPQSTEGYADNDSVKVPDEADMQRAREIFDELRRRASEPARPQFERDYIDRLLRRF